MSNVTIRETKDVAVIKSVLCDPDIYSRISDDSCPPSEEFEPPLDVQYIAGWVNGDIIGLMIYHVVNDRLKCHLQVLPEFRRKYARQFAQMAFCEAKNASIYAEIPKLYPEVIRFAKDLGFKRVGFIEKGHLKNGLSYDVEILRLENGLC